MMGVWPFAIGLLHLVAASAALVLAAWLATSRRAQGKAVLPIAAALVASAFWAFAAIGTQPEFLIVRLLLSVSDLCWLLVLSRLFAHDDRDKSVAPIRPVVLALAFVELMQIALAIGEMQYAGQLGASLLILRFSITFRLLFCIGALVLVHNLYAGASQQSRQSLRWPAAALAAMWLYDLNLYTIAYLIDSLPVILEELRGAAVLIAVFLLALGNLRKESELRFSPSRSFAFQSFSLLVIGVYLVVMVVIAQGIHYVGRDYGSVLQLGFLLLASVAALAVLPSRKMRGWLRVMLSKHLFQHRYDYRSEWIRFTETMGRAGPQAPPLHERIVQAVADITESPAGLLLTTREGGGMELAARWQWPDIEVPAEALDAAAVSFLEQSQFIVDLDDIRSQRAEGVPAAASPAWLKNDGAAWAMVPLLHYGRLVGLVVLARSPASRGLDWEDFDLLRVAGRQLASYLAEQASQDALGEAQKFDEFNRRFAFVMHDIKNLASQLSLLARNAEKHADKAEFRADMLITLRNSTDKLQALLTRLGRYGAQGKAQRQQVELAALVQRVSGQYAGKHTLVTLGCDPVTVEADSEALEQALVHLVQNAFEASAADAPVFIDLRREPENAIIEVVDSGAGMSPEFIRTQLFKPFHSSKPGGFGIGAYEARELVRAMGGRLDVESREGLGTRFILRLPTSETVQIMRSMNELQAKVA